MDELTKQTKWRKRTNYTSGGAIGGGAVAMAHGTQGKPVPPGKPLIVGDAQKKGVPNPELVVPTAKGTHVIPLKDLPKKGYGTGKLRRCAFGTFAMGGPVAHPPQYRVPNSATETAPLTRIRPPGM